MPSNPGPILTSNPCNNTVTSTIVARERSFRLNNSWFEGSTRNHPVIRIRATCAIIFVSNNREKGIKLFSSIKESTQSFLLDLPRILFILLHVFFELDVEFFEKIPNRDLIIT